MSFAACDERCARLRTSDATTAKPRPASPARAASTAALSASRLVWRAISSITPMMSEILRDDSSIFAIAPTALATTSPPRSATSRVVGRRRFACWAFSAFFFTVAEICSIDAEVSSSDAACSSVRCDRSVVAVEISAEALVTSRAEVFTSAMVRAHLVRHRADGVGDLADLVLAAGRGTVTAKLPTASSSSGFTSARIGGRSTGWRTPSYRSG